jgi:hypothetical protein
MPVTEEQKRAAETIIANLSREEFRALVMEAFKQAAAEFLDKLAQRGFENFGRYIARLLWGACIAGALYGLLWIYSATNGFGTMARKVISGE